MTGSDVFVESTSGGCFKITLRTIHSNLEMFKVLVFLQDARSGGFKVTNITGVEDVLVDRGEVSPEGAVV